MRRGACEYRPATCHVNAAASNNQTKLHPKAARADCDSEGTDLALAPDLPSGHNVPIEQPRLVVETIREVVQAAENRPRQ